MTKVGDLKFPNWQNWPLLEPRDVLAILLMVSTMIFHVSGPNHKVNGFYRTRVCAVLAVRGTLIKIQSMIQRQQRGISRETNLKKFLFMPMKMELKSYQNLIFQHMHQLQSNQWNTDIIQAAMTSIVKAFHKFTCLKYRVKYVKPMKTKRSWRDFSKKKWLARYYDGQVNPCIQSTYTFLDTVVASVKSMYQEVDLFDPSNPPVKDLSIRSFTEAVRTEDRSLWSSDPVLSLSYWRWWNTGICMDRIARMR